jgi:hypothetical protein
MLITSSCTVDIFLMIVFHVKKIGKRHRNEGNYGKSIIILKTEFTLFPMLLIHIKSMLNVQLNEEVFNEMLEKVSRYSFFFCVFSFFIVQGSKPGSYICF